MRLNIIPLYSQAAPGSEDWTWSEQEEPPREPVPVPHVRNVTHPTLTAFIPDARLATGAAMIVCPGGGYSFLAIEHEGFEVARWLQEHGVAAFVLKYRVNRTPESVEDFAEEGKKMRALPPEITERMMEEATKMIIPLARADGLQAIKLVRERAAEWGLDPKRIGIMGFSAGGSVTAGVALKYNEDSRPDFAAVIYGALFGEIRVPPDAPPLFILVANDDPISAGPSLELFKAWQAAGIPVEFHNYSKGNHGFGMNKQGLPSDGWIERLWDWMRCL